MLSRRGRDSIVDGRVIDGLLSLLTTWSAGRWRRWWRLFLSCHGVIERVGGTRSWCRSMDLFEIQGSNAIPNGAHRSLFGHVEDGDGARVGSGEWMVKVVVAMLLLLIVVVVVVGQRERRWLLCTVERPVHRWRSPCAATTQVGNLATGTDAVKGDNECRE